MFMYTLRFPNYEVETSFTDQLSRAYHPRLTFSNYLYQLIQAIQGGDTQAFIDWLKEYLANIPYDIQIAQEKYYQSLVYGVLLLCGADMQTEVRTNKGRIDAVLKAPNHLYIIEFKLNQSAETGLAPGPRETPAAAPAHHQLFLRQRRTQHHRLEREHRRIKLYSTTQRPRNCGAFDILSSLFTRTQYSTNLLHQPCIGWQPGHGSYFLGP